MRCEEVAVLLPAMLDGDGPVALPVQRHVESCLQCQAELARYRLMLRGLRLLRTQFVEPAPGLLGETLLAITEASERRAVRSVLGNRRAAYAGAIGAALAAAGATAAIVVAKRARRRARPLRTLPPSRSWRLRRRAARAAVTELRPGRSGRGH